MCKIICVTRRSAVNENFLTRIEKICAGGIDRIILREKDMSEKDYELLAMQVKEICGAYNVPLSLHTYTGAAHSLEIKDIHFTYHDFMSSDTSGFETTGVSVHDPGEAAAAAVNVPGYITAGHIFATDCKKGVPPRGTDFLSDICSQVKPFKIPVYAIGGITPENAGECIKAGAAGICVMSSLMTCGDPAGYIRALRRSAL